MSLDRCHFMALDFGGNKLKTEDIKKLAEEFRSFQLTIERETIARLVSKNIRGNPNFIIIDTHEIETMKEEATKAWVLWKEHGYEKLVRK